MILLSALAACDTDVTDDPKPDEPDADTDTDTDTDADADLWDWCPSPDTAVGDPAWEGRAEVGDGALYCVNPSEHLTLEESLAAKAQLRVVPGSYPVPVEDGDAFALGLPACVAFADGTGLATDGAGTATVQTSAWGGTAYSSATWWQPAGGSSIELTLTTVTEEGSAFPPVSVDGEPGDPYGGAGFFATLHPTPDGTWDAGSRGFTTCDTDTWTRGVHTVAFDGGAVELEVLIGESAASTEPSAFVRASGTLDGVAFEQRDYWALVYRPEHHHFTRHFAVILPETIGEACALRVEGLDPYGETGSETVSLAGCDLAVAATRSVESSTYTRE
ncbi:MAG: hypothetical protein ACOZNI_17470 [Myxococcota bacterium]